MQQYKTIEEYDAQVKKEVGETRNGNIAEKDEEFMKIWHSIDRS